jgi:hypothetical protein
MKHCISVVRMSNHVGEQGECLVAVALEPMQLHAALRLEFVLEVLLVVSPRRSFSDGELGEIRLGVRVLVDKPLGQSTSVPRPATSLVGKELIDE